MLEIDVSFNFFGLQQKYKKRTVYSCFWYSVDFKVVLYTLSVEGIAGIIFFHFSSFFLKKVIAVKESISIFGPENWQSGRMHWS